MEIYLFTVAYVSLTCKSGSKSGPYKPKLTNCFDSELQAVLCRCSCRLASIIERIDLGCASNVMRVLVCLTAPSLEFQTCLTAGCIANEDFAETVVDQLADV